MALYELHGTWELDSPVLILAMEGWIDAGLGGGGALAQVMSTIPTEVLATFDGDQLVDFRSRRPTVRISDGLLSGISWPEIQVRVGKDPGGQDTLLLTGPEPDMRWGAFAEEVVGLSTKLGVRLATGLGAFPAPVPHTRPVRLACTATSRDLAEAVGYVPGNLEVPSGIHAVLQEGLGSVGIPAVGLWARVPHYVSGMPYPAASAALIESLVKVTGLRIDASELQEAAQMAAERLDEVIAASDEHAQMVRQLEETVDAEVSDPPPLNLSDLPSGDELAEELQRFLRDQ
jgi:proteasome assembly chaperone (PAC2) family protein